MPNIDIDQLMQELMEAQGNLCVNDAKKSSLFVLARLIPNMDEKAWTKLCAKAPSMGWYAFEVNGDNPHIPLAPPQKPAEPDQKLEDHLLKANFIQHLELEVARAVRSNASLALVHFGQSSNQKKSLKDSTFILQKAVHKYGDPCDIMGAISKDRLALIIPGAKVFKAQNLVEDIINFCAKEGLNLKAGITGSMGKDCNCHNLFEQAAISLQEILEEKQNTKVYQENKSNMDATLVHSHEKRFLFGG